jgi:hypothetical protein
MNNVKCWNCHTEIDTPLLGSPQNRNKISATHIVELLQDNIFDFSRGNVIVNMTDLLDEIKMVLEKNL